MKKNIKVTKATNILLTATMSATIGISGAMILGDNSPFVPVDVMAYEKTGEWVTVPGIEGGQIRFDSSTGSITETEFANEIIVANIPATINGVPVKSVGGFFASAHLESVVIPEGVTRIEQSAFGECGNLKSITIPSTITEVGMYAFNFCHSLESIMIPAVENTERMFILCSSLKDIVLAEGTVIVGVHTFSECYSLQNVILPSSVTTIEDSAFYSCTSLSNITIPSGVTSIGRIAFDECTSLVNINVDNNSNTYSSVEGVLVNKDATQLVLYPMGRTASSYTVPSSITTIKDGAFYNATSLKSLVIPSSVTNIEVGAFSGSSSYGSNLTNVYYEGTEEQWNNMDLVINGNLEDLTIHYNWSAETTSQPTETFTQNTGEDLGELIYKELITPQYEDATTFNDGLLAVKKDGKWGYVNENNDIIIPFEYDFAGNFSEGLAVVGELNYDTYYNKAYKVGFIDKQGNYTPFRFSEDEPADVVLASPTNNVEELDGLMSMQWFHNGYYIPYNLAIANIDTNIVFERTGFGSDTISGDGLSGQINSSYAVYSYPSTSRIENIETGETISMEQSTLLFSSPEQGLIMAVDNNKPALGFISMDDVLSGNQDKWFIQPTYISYTYSDLNKSNRFFDSNGFAIVASADNYKFGAIDKDNNTVIPFEYDMLYPFREGLSNFELNGKWGFINDKGVVVIPAQYDQATGFGNGVAIVQNGSSIDLINRSGNIVDGSEEIDKSSYFIQNSDGTLILYNPTEYITIEKDGKKGLAKVEYKPALPTTQELNSWSYEEVISAIDNNLIPVSMQNSYEQSISRSEVTTLIINLLEDILDKSIQDIVKDKTDKDLDILVGEYPFKDTSSNEVVAGYALGIISGKSNNMFEPNALVSKQELATLLTRVANLLGEDTTANKSNISDIDTVDSWSLDSVNYILDNDIMTVDTSEQVGTFSPKASYSKEETFLTIERMYQILNK